MKQISYASYGMIFMVKDKGRLLLFSVCYFVCALVPRIPALPLKESTNLVLDDSSILTQSCATQDASDFQVGKTFIGEIADLCASPEGDLVSSAIKNVGLTCTAISVVDAVFTFKERHQVNSKTSLAIECEVYSDIRFKNYSYAFPSQFFDVLTDNGWSIQSYSTQKTSVYDDEVQYRKFSTSDRACTGGYTFFGIFDPASAHAVSDTMLESILNSVEGDTKISSYSIHSADPDRDGGTRGLSSLWVNQNAIVYSSNDVEPVDWSVKVCEFSVVQSSIKKKDTSSRDKKSGQTVILVIVILVILVLALFFCTTK